MSNVKEKPGRAEEKAEKCLYGRNSMGHGLCLEPWHVETAPKCKPCEPVILWLYSILAIISVVG